MADRGPLPDPKQPQTSSPAKSGGGSEARGDRMMGQQHDKKRPVVGNDVPDESKERHTEIAVDAGKRGH